MEIEISAEDRLLILQRIADRVFDEHRKDFDLMSPSEVAGYLDISAKTLAELKGLPRITIVPNKIIRYDRADVKAWLAENRA